MNIFKQKDDGKYLGNVWGWKVSMVGGIVLSALLALMIYRHVSMGVPPGYEETDFLHFDPSPIKSKDTIRK